MPKPVVRRITIDGNKKFKDKRPRKLVEHKEGVRLDEPQVVADANAIQKFYTDAGYHKTKVQRSIHKIPNTNKVNIEFQVEEEPRAKTGAIRFAGNTAFTDRKLRKTIKTKRSWWSLILRVGFFNENSVSIDKDALTDLYGTAGYLDFKIDRIEQRYNARKTWISLTFYLDEGQPYAVKSVSITGNERFAEDELRGEVELEPGATYNSAIEQSDISRIKGRYEALGYLDLRCFPVHATDSFNHTVDIEYRIIEGAACRIRDIYITGNEVTKDHVIRRELAIQPGDLGDAGKIRASKSRLMGLNYFETVDVTPVATEKAEAKDISIKVLEKRTGQLMIGAGFSSEDAVVGYFEVMQSNFDYRNPPTFRGGGQRLRMRTQLGTKRTDFTLSFTEPWWFHRRLRLDLDLYGRTRLEDDYDQETLGFGFTVSRPIKRWKYWRHSAGIRLETIDLTDFDDDVSPELLAEEGSYTTNSLNLGVARDSRNRVLMPSRGSRLSLNSEILSEAFGSYGDVYRLRLRGTKYFPLAYDTVLKLGAEIGVSDSFSGEDVAIFNRYFAGGAYSVRGFKRRDISPVDANGDPIGGKSMLVGGAEFIFPIFEKIQGSLFCDLGNVWAEVDEVNPGEMNVGIGVGIQFNLPIGPIRLDYGWPVTREQEHMGTSGRLHFNLGYFF